MHVYIHMCILVAMMSSPWKLLYALKVTKNTKLKFVFGKAPQTSDKHYDIDVFKNISNKSIRKLAACVAKLSTP